VGPQLRERRRPDAADVEERVDARERAVAVAVRDDRRGGARTDARERFERGGGRRVDVERCGGARRVRRRGT